MSESKTTMTRREWIVAYCDAFRAVAKARGWTTDNIESGWLADCMPGDAWLSHGHRDPAKVAAEDVIACEREAANA
jgi:hypothetical protein